MSNFHVISSPSNLQDLLNQDLNKLSVLYFRADWAEPCTQMDLIIASLAKKNPLVLFLSIEAESLPDISESFEVDAVPYFILLRGHSLLQKISGAQPIILSSAISNHSVKVLSSTTQSVPSSTSVYTPAEEIVDETDVQLEQRCQDLLKVDRIVLFMKGDRDTPRCGFSKTLIGLLNKMEVEYSTFDILEDDSVRQKLKILNDWPTFPQLIINGEFIGGLDVVKELISSGEMDELLA